MPGHAGCRYRNPLRPSETSDTTLRLVLQTSTIGTGASFWAFCFLYPVPGITLYRFSHVFLKQDSSRLLRSSFTLLATYRASPFGPFPASASLVAFCIQTLPSFVEAKRNAAQRRAHQVSKTTCVLLTGCISQWIIGLGSFMASWQRQTKDFAHTKGDKYTSLIFDNRGMGESDKPLMRYSTSEMALDIFDLLQHVGWTEKRQLHVIGVSMGGMIAQELVSR
jgi:hypothetical protein